MFDQLTTWFARPIWLRHVAWIVSFYLILLHNNPDLDAIASEELN